MRKVICAACEYAGILILGPRHWDKTMHKQYKLMHKSKDNFPKGCLFRQGFIDQFGIFMDRKEAMQVANTANQPIDIDRGCGGDNTTLYSEGLY